MANKSLFKSLRAKMAPLTNAFNRAGAPAYQLAPSHALAQYAATGCLSRTFYASAETQLDTVLGLCDQVAPQFLAQTAVFCRERGFMKDMPALLCAVLSRRDPALLRQVFPRVIDDARMVRNFVQILRSGVTGRKSLGTAPKRLVQQWLATRTEEQLFRAAVGNEPSLADVIKMVHPQPATPARKALYGYLLGRAHDAALLPPLVQAYEHYKRDNSGHVPDVPFQMLTALNLGPVEWAEIARQAPWQMTRMNLNTFARRGVFASPALTRQVAERLRDPAQVRRARVFPYQLLLAFKNAEGKVPAEVRHALQDAMEIALKNVPALHGRVYVCVDVSGSMQAAVTGHRAGATSAARCIDVAALIAAAVLRKNPKAQVLPFGTTVMSANLNPKDSVMKNAKKLADLNGGGTNCSAPLEQLNRERAQSGLILMVSDNESWVDARYGRGTETMRQWQVFKQRNPEARMVCLDLVPNATTQAEENVDVLNIGGFSDSVFELVALFAEGQMNAKHWVGEIESIAL